MTLQTKKSRFILFPDGNKVFISVLKEDGNPFMALPEQIQKEVDDGNVQEVDEDAQVFMDGDDLSSSMPQDQYGRLRKDQYKIIEEQLDSLWHDVNSGFFGDNAKKSNWFKGIKTIKEKYPKK